MTLKSGTGQACAACKYQRRRCTPECLLAPFFPADQPKMFQNVHRLFGVKNIQNLLKDLGPDEKVMAMKSIKFHANQRDRYPVYGCLVDIQQLTYQIQILEEELQVVLQQLAHHKQRQHQPQETSSPITDYFSELQLGVAPPGDVPIVHEDNPLPLVAPQPQVSCSNSDNVDYDINYLDFKDNYNVVNSLGQQSNDNNTMLMPLIVPTIQETIQVDYNEMHPFSDRFDDTQSYIGSKEVYESSLDSPLRDSRELDEEMDENELKSAAACFSLTSVN